MKNISILFVDDDDAMEEIIKEILKVLNYQITFVTHSPDALKIFETNPKEFDLVITDYNMPEMNGDALAIKLHAIRDDIPIILATGCRDLSKEAVLKCDIDEFLLKPYSSEKLKTLIQKVLGESNNK